MLRKVDRKDLRVSVLKVPKIVLSLERILEDLFILSRLLFRVGGLQADPIESLDTDGTLMSVGQRLEGHENILVEVVEHLLLQLLYEARVWPVADGEIPLETSNPPLCLYLVPAVPDAGHQQADDQHQCSEHSQDDSVRKLLGFSLSLSSKLT